MPRKFTRYYEVQGASPRFSNTRSALDHLQKLGRPPRSLDISDIPPKVETVIEIVGVLASDIIEANRPGTSSVAAVHIKAKWNTLGPWIKFLLEQIALAQELPLTPQGVAARQRTLATVPIALMFPGRHDSDALAFIKRTSSYFHSLIAQVWCRSIEENHFSWGFWSRALVDIGFCKTDPSKPIPSAFGGPGPYQASTELGLMFVHHLTHHIPRIPKMSIEDLEELEDFLMCLTPATFGDTLECPTNLLTVRIYTIPALVGIVSSLATKRKTLRDTSVDSDEGKCARGVTVVASGFVENLMTDCFYASVALKAGILEALFKAPRCLFSFEDHLKPVTKYLSYWSVEILGNVSRFLVYPSVLHQFLRVIRRIDRIDGLEEFQSGARKTLWGHWEDVKKKASSLQEVRGRLQLDTSSLCSAAQCPLMRSTPFEQKPHWGRCSRCESVIYCSYACQRADWKEGHRNMCKMLNKARLAGRPTPARFDYAFFHEWENHYFASHIEYIVKSVHDLLASLSLPGRRLSEDQQLIKSQRKNPIIFFDFDKTGLLHPQDCIRILDTNSLVVHVKKLSIDCSEFDRGVDANWTAKLIRIWRGPSVDKEYALVVASFPRDNVTPWPIHKVLPLELPDRCLRCEEGGS